MGGEYGEAQNRVCDRCIILLGYIADRPSEFGCPYAECQHGTIANSDA